jgi:hypothetical protein
VSIVSEMKTDGLSKNEHASVLQIAVISNMVIFLPMLMVMLEMLTS